MKRHVTAALLCLVHGAVFAITPLSSEEIQRAVDEAAEQYLGDFPPGWHIVTQREYFYGSVSRDVMEKYIRVFESFPSTREFLQLPLPRPSPSEMLLVRPSSLESFVSP